MSINIQVRLYVWRLLSNIAASLILTCLCVPASNAAVHICYITNGKIRSISLHDDIPICSHTLYNLRQSNLVLDCCALLGRNASSGAVYFEYNDNAYEEVYAIEKDRMVQVLTNSDDPVLSPDGTQIAFVRGSNVDVYSGKTKSIGTVATNGQQLSWGSRCTFIAFAKGSSRNDDTDEIDIVDISTGKVVFKKPDVDASVPYLSPTGKYLDYLRELPNGVQGDILVPTGARASYATVRQEVTPDGLLPETVEDWSKDDKWILWDWQQRNTNNPGADPVDHVGVTSIDGKFHRDLSSGEDAKFSPDGRMIFFLKAKGQGRTDLWVAETRLSQPHLLIANVDSYFVY